MKLAFKLFKYEVLNITRSRWVFVYSLFLLLLSAVFLYLAGSPGKALVTISSVIIVLVPLTCILFSTFYWYNAERLTEILLTQPINRRVVLITRYLALSLSLALGFLIGVLMPFLVSGYGSMDMIWLSVFGIFLAVVFCAMGLWIGVSVQDRMRGVGLSFAIWFYFILMHDMIVLTSLIFAKEYPMDFVASVLAAINPIGLTRVILLVLQDAPMLLGHSGAMIRESLLGQGGLGVAVFIMIFWILAPIVFAVRKFQKRDL